MSNDKNRPTWKRHMTAVRIKRGGANSSSRQSASGSNKNYSSYLPAVYTGVPNRIDRYQQYEQMDQDPEISTGLDILAEFCTQNSDDFEGAFKIHYKDSQMGDTEVTTLENRLDAWNDLNDFSTRIFDIFRSVLKHGDQFFVRDPETFELHWVEPSHVEKITLNESKGKEPAVYFIKDLSLNLQTKVVSNQNNQRDAIAYPGAMPHTLSGVGQQYGSVGGGSGNGGSDGSPFPGTAGQTVLPVDAKHVVHLSLNTGMDLFYPFGTSVLEKIFKTYKQKELLEDSIIIYRVQRAPERRVFKIDTGDMPEHMAMQHVERIKNEIHQRRIPTNRGGSTSLMDAAYNPLCLDMETRIPLLDGRTLSIRELTAEYKEGKQNWVYSCHPETGQIVPGNITWAGVTQKSAKVIKLTFDNGETITCTPDHKIPVLGFGFKEAKDITINDSLISFSKKYETMISNDTGRTYEMIYDHSTLSYEYTHRIVGNYFREIENHQEFTYLNENIDKVKNIIHHKDYDRYNNDPRNLQFMNKDDHFRFHSDHRSQAWAAMSTDEYNRVCLKISETLKSNYKNMNSDDRNKVTENMRAAQKQAVLYRKTPEGATQYNTSTKGIKSKHYEEHPEQLRKWLDSSKAQRDAPWCNTKTVYTRDMLNRISTLVKTNDASKTQAVELCSRDSLLMELFSTNNPVPENGIDNISRDEWNCNRLEQIIKYFGYTGWRQYKKQISEYNHKVVSIEYLNDEIEVGTITVDGDERWHNYHTFATEAGVFVKNSILEDFFFPQTADGRGSSVETLPGGDNLGQIDDLRWFNNKLIRGLKIPQSYLPFGPEDGQHVVNDGHMGQALIQEFRFNKYCQRLQATIIKKFDSEFKAYLEESGYNFNYKSFSVCFIPPMNFAAYRKAELESTLIASYAGLNDLPFIAKQTILHKMGWTQDDIIENERFWLQENPDKTSSTAPSEQASLSSVGIENPAEMDPSSTDTMEDDGQGADPDAGSVISGDESGQSDTF